jgi:hypothetical protein
MMDEVIEAKGDFWQQSSLVLILMLMLTLLLLLSLTPMMRSPSLRPGISRPDLFPAQLPFLAFSLRLTLALSALSS